MFEILKHALGVREKGSPLEQLGLIEKASSIAESLEQGGAPYDLYTILEDEKIPFELKMLMLGFLARDMKLTYLERKDIDYLFWKGEEVATLIEVFLNSIVPPPSRFPSLYDYAKTVNLYQILPHNLRALILAAIKRSTYGFERRLQSTRHYYFGYGAPGGVR